jgi:hypothetical protein
VEAAAHCSGQEGTITFEDQEPTPQRASRRSPRRPRTYAPPKAGSRAWLIVAVVSMMVAVAGWTTVVMLVITRPSSSPVAAASIPAAAASQSDATSHDAPSLEALLPTSWSGTTLTTTSWTGGAILGSDDWSQSIVSFLAAREKTPDDLLVAQAYDPLGTIDLAVVAFQANGISPADMVQAIIAAWQVDYPGLSTSTVTLGGKQVIKGVFPEEAITSYWYASADVAFEVDTSDETTANGVLAQLP